jgi:hypothetical protein
MYPDQKQFSESKSIHLVMQTINSDSRNRSKTELKGRAEAVSLHTALLV